MMVSVLKIKLFAILMMDVHMIPLTNAEMEAVKKTQINAQTPK